MLRAATTRWTCGLRPGRRAGGVAWTRSFGEGTRVKGTFDAGAVTMDMALHSAFPASAMAYGYSVDSPTMVEEAWEGGEVRRGYAAADDAAISGADNDTDIRTKKDDAAFEDTTGHINSNSNDYSAVRYAPVRERAASYVPPTERVPPDHLRPATRICAYQCCSDPSLLSACTAHAPAARRKYRAPQPRCIYDHARSHCVGVDARLELGRARARCAAPRRGRGRAGGVGHERRG